MRNKPDITVLCPCCEVGEVDCYIDPGEPAITSGPSDSWYPGCPAGLDSWEADCQCSESSLVDEAAYARAIERVAMEQAVRP